jgi:hypothetical protein
MFMNSTATLSCQYQLRGSQRAPEIVMAWVPNDTHWFDALPGNPYDGHAIAEIIPDMVSMAEKKCARWRGKSVPVWLIKKGGDAPGVVCLT